MVRFLVFCLLVAGSSVVAGEDKVDYCRINADHTMCKYQKVSSSCGTDVYRGVTSREATTILNEHNRLRNKVASGDERHGSPGPQPKAGNMGHLVWNEQLADVAQRWADQCQAGHDKYRETPSFSSVGQNVLLTMDCRMPPRWDRTIKRWYDEVGSWNSSNVGSFRNDIHTDDYTQLVWAETSAVGCGFIRFLADFHCKQMFVCNYGPGGNQDNSAVYRASEPRSSCSSAALDKKYPALC